MWRSTSRWSLRVEVEEARARSAARFGAVERHRPERGRGRVLQRALQPRLVARDQQLPASRSSAAALRDAARALASAGTRSLHTYHQAMSCGLTNETVVHHGSRAALLREPVRELAARCAGPRASPARAPPSGEGYVPPAKP